MKHVHFLGLGGSGASAVASIAQAQGFRVSGCDKVPNNEFTQNFKSDQILKGHSPNHLEGVNILAVTPAIFSLDPNNPELEAAKQKGIEVLTWQQFMGKYLEEDKLVIAVCGTHGKSTATAMIGSLLEDGGLDPTVELGAIVPRWDKNYKIGKSKYFVTEADEFNDNFLASFPDIIVVNNIEFDHPEYFQDFAAYKQSFKKFLAQSKEKIIANLADQAVADVINSLNKNITIINFSHYLIDFPLQIPGQFNILNASAAYQVGVALGIEAEIIKKSLSNFTGISRRFELIGEYQGAKVYSDFGHHPTEIKVNLETIRQKFPEQKITVIFQPHMFSRTKSLFSDFVNVFQTAPVDQTFIADIYPSRELDTNLVNSQQLVEAIGKPNIKYFSTAEQILNKLRTEVKTDEVLLFIGAGDTDKWARQLVSSN